MEHLPGILRKVKKEDGHTTLIVKFMRKHVNFRMYVCVFIYLFIMSYAYRFTHVNSDHLSVQIQMMHHPELMLLLVETF